MTGEGLRIHHPTERDVVLFVPVPAKVPGLRGVLKDVRIHLDENGDSIVSEGVWNELQRSKQSGLSAHEFVILNVVVDPPTLVVGLGRERVRRTVKENQSAIAQRFMQRGKVS